MADILIESVSHGSQSMAKQTARAYLNDKIIKSNYQTNARSPVK